jgi:hypothetical protein
MNQNKKGSGKPKSQGTSRRARAGPRVAANNNRRAPVELFGARGNIVSNTTSLPAAFDTLEGNVAFTRVTGAVMHPTEGINGIRIMGCQPLTDIATAAANTGVFTTGTLATSTANYIPISPDALNGPLAAQANLHAKYVFRDILIEYISTVATSQANSICLNLDSDTDPANVSTSFSTARQISPSIVFPFRHDRAYLHVHYDGDELFYTEIDNATIAGNRTTVQYTLNGWPNAASAGAITYGYANIYYVIDLYQSVSSRGFTARANPQEQQLLKEYLANLRKNLKVDTTGESEKYISIPAPSQVRSGFFSSR